MMKHNLLGQRFGMLTVEGRDFTTPKRVAWTCRCDCGTQKVALSHNLMSGATSHCGCRRRPLNSERRSKYLGTKSGRLTVLEYLLLNDRQMLRCVCDCGTTVTVQYSNFVSKKQKSCGCLGKEARITHGMSTSPLYRYWYSLVSRCTRPSDRLYEAYGAKGVLIADRWKTFDAFYVDVGNRPSPAHRLVRIDEAKGFEPGNCEWTTEERKPKGRRITQWVEVGGQRLSVKEAARLAGISRQAMDLRLKSGRTGEDLLNSDRLTSRGKFVYKGERMTLKALSAVTGLKMSALARRMRTYDLPPEEAITFTKRQLHEVNGERLTLTEISRRYCISPATLRDRMRRGLTAQQAVDRGRSSMLKPVYASSFIGLVGAPKSFIAEKTSQGLAEQEIAQLWELELEKRQNERAKQKRESVRLWRVRNGKRQRERLRPHG